MYSEAEGIPKRFMCQPWRILCLSKYNILLSKDWERTQALFKKREMDGLEHDIGITPKYMDTFSTRILSILSIT